MSQSPVRHAVVLDASALLCYLLQEPGSERVAACIDEGDALMSSVNLAEVLSKGAERGLDISAQRALVQTLPIEWVPFDTEAALLCASLRPPTRAQGLSLGDRCCLALAMQRSAKVVSADRAWAALQIDGLDIELLR